MRRSDFLVMAVAGAGLVLGLWQPRLWYLAVLMGFCALVLPGLARQEAIP